MLICSAYIGSVEKRRRQHSDEYDPRDGFRCWSPIPSDDDETDAPFAGTRRGRKDSEEAARDGYPTFLRTKVIDPAALSKLRACGTSVTYFGGRVIDTQPYKVSPGIWVYIPYGHFLEYE